MADLTKYLPYLRRLEPESEQGRLRETLISWCNIQSGTSNLEGLARMSLRLREALSGLADEVGEVDVGSCLLPGDDGEPREQVLGCALRAFRRPRAPLRVLLGGHMDTVFDPEHPFRESRLREGGVLNAPGATDMKGGLLVMIEALEMLEASPFAQQIGWEVLIGADEEIGSPGTGPLWSDAARRNDLGLIFEPALPGGGLVVERRGSGRFTAVAYGRAAHAGRDFSNGRNAIAAMGKLVAAIHELNGQVPEATFNVGYIHGGHAPNIVPARCMARVDVRVARPEQQEHALRLLSECARRADGAGEVRVTWEGEFIRPAKALTPEVDALFQEMRRCGAELGLVLEAGSTGGGSDGNILGAAGLPTLDSMGVRGGNIHSDDEFVVLESIPERARLTALFLMKLAAGDLRLPGSGFRRRPA